MTAQLDRDIFGTLVSRREASGVRRYYHTDGLGSTTALTDEAGGVAASMFYDAWGNVRVSTGTGHGKYRFTGAELDTSSDLYHMGARFYDPSIGRWLGEDPLQDRQFEPASLNFYTYALNNPALIVDLDGKRPLDDADGTGSASGSGQEPATESDAERALREILGVFEKNLTTIGTAAAIAGAVAAGASVVIVAGMASGPVVVAISFTAITASTTATAIALVQVSRGQITLLSAAFTIGTSAASLFPPFGAFRIAQIARSATLPTGNQLVQVLGWVIARALGMAGLAVH